MGGRVSWMGSVGKTLGELRDNPTYHTSLLSPSLLDGDNDVRIANIMTPDSKKGHPATLMPSRLDGGTKPSNKLSTTSSNPRTQDKDKEWNC
ncbi:hypothetical protein K443DRAFT_133063 [Laccaria amethystina LaAM-08-1]|uniref:Uncharacterized protein n=1 Tax=Laccaria amethystina LaAM-08-1 TaxID=1095629 RepID=A0A0C9XU69_9AGAR|nr:hypothetical protein K443DRAFT_133063 [Laccaria amethystina LaAM-08-1]